MARPADRRAKIELLRAAEAVFVEHGLSAAKVEDITARAGVSKGAFYLHFESKDDCFRQIVEAFLAKLASCLDEEAPRDAGVHDVQAWADFLAEWHAHTVEIFEFCWQNRGLMRILFTGGSASPYGYLMDEFAERTARQIEAWSRHLMSIGVYREDLDPEVLPALVAGGYERLIREMIKRPKRPDVEGWARHALDLTTRGLLTEEARSVLDRQVSERRPLEGRAPITLGDTPKPPAAAPARGTRARKA